MRQHHHLMPDGWTAAPPDEEGRLDHDPQAAASTLGCSPHHTAAGLVVLLRPGNGAVMSSVADQEADMPRSIPSDAL